MDRYKNMNFNGFGCLYIIIFTTIYYLKSDINKKLLSRTSVPTSIAADDSSRHPAVPQHPQDVHLDQVGGHLAPSWPQPPRTLAPRTVVALLALRAQLWPKIFRHNCAQNNCEKSFWCNCDRRRNPCDPPHHILNVSLPVTLIEGGTLEGVWGAHQEFDPIPQKSSNFRGS